MAVADAPDPPPPLIVTFGVEVYWLPLLIRVIEATESPSRVANAVAVSPVGEASIVISGVDV